MIAPAAPHAPARALSKAVLVVVGDSAVRELLAVNLRHAGVFPVLAATVDDGRRLAGEVLPDGVLLDLDAFVQPSTGSLRFEKIPEGVPILMLTSRLDEACGVDGERCGASACVRKPFHPRNLVGEVLRHLRASEGDSETCDGVEPPRRRASPRPRAMRAGPLELDPAGHQAWLHFEGRSSAVPLAPREIRMLQCLMLHPERVLSREAIRSEAWRGDEEVDLRTVDQYIKRLRRKLERLGASELVQTVKGHGYRLHVGRPLSA